MLDTMLDYNEKRLRAATDKALIEEIAPAIRAAIAKTAPTLVLETDNPFALYAAKALLIKRLSDMLTLSDTAEMDHLSPVMLEDNQYVRYWVENLG